MKILSPCGNFESLKMAVYSGADEVYLGINDFNARNNIDGFNLSDLKDAVDFCHLYGVKVLLAINILFTDDEIQDALNVVVDAYNYGVDAFIIQDLGLASLVNKNYPMVELHASTQMGIHNLEGVIAIEKYGFKRVVLARETPLDEIKRIKSNSNIEIEYFAHGALCVCFSGNCYLSSYALNESGNRGRCKQLCRLPYTLSFNDKKLKKGFLLSAKDFCLIDRLSDLQKAGVDVLKIEGRARRPFYVGTITRAYREALDGKTIDKEKIDLAFNRGFTEGYFNGNGQIISNLNNHTGIFIGKVSRVNEGRKFDQVYFTSNRELSPKSTFKFFDNGEERTTLSAFDLKKIGKGEYVLTTTQKVRVGDKINLIVDQAEEDKLLSQIQKIKVKIDVYAEKGWPIKASFNVRGKEYVVLGEKLDQSINNPLTKEEIISNFSKSQEFDVLVTVKALDSVFILKKNLNAFRREVLDEIKSLIAQIDREKIDYIKPSNSREIQAFSDYVIVDNYDKKIKEKNVVYSPCEYTIEGVKKFINWAEKNDKNPYLDLPNFALKSDVELLKDIVEKTNIKIVANNYYALTFDCEKIIGGGLNVYNGYTASEYALPIIFAENSVYKKENFAYMTLRHCPFKSHLKSDCKNCPYKDGYTLTMDSGKVMKIKRKKLSTCTFYLTD